MIVEPKVRGFICTTAHPVGCARQVANQIAYVRSKGPIANGPKKVLIIGASTGFGLSSRITAAFGCGADTVGVFFERPASGGRTASPGWYTSVAFENEARAAGLKCRSINGDAFTDDIKQQTIQAVKEVLGKVDLVIYSLASPRRTHPRSGETFRSVLRPINETVTSKTVDTNSGVVTQITLEPASEEDIRGTIGVMGGEDWAMWMEALKGADVLAKGVRTVAYSYVGPRITQAIYRNGTIGAAKQDLERHAQLIQKSLEGLGGEARISVNKALVTQASSAIPVMPLYIALLYRVMKEKGVHEGCIEQMQRLFAEKLCVTSQATPTDEEGRIRVDDLEFLPDVQEEVEKRFAKVSTENLEEISDIREYRKEFLSLFGFGLEKVDYQADVEIDLPLLPS